MKYKLFYRLGALTMHITPMFRVSTLRSAHMNASQILAFFGWVLVVATCAALVGALLAGANWSDGLSKAVPAGVFFALAGHFFTQSKTVLDNAEKRSLFNLDGFRKAFDHAKSLLQDGNNNRAKWIEAARSLAHGEELAKGVTHPSHKRVLELERLRFRGIFYEAIATKPAGSFYGVPPQASLDDAARASTAPEHANGRRIPTNHEIDEGSIRAVWLATSWPEGYQDPMALRFEPKELARLRLLYRELHRYFDHKGMWHSKAGVLHPRRANGH